MAAAAAAAAAAVDDAAVLRFCDGWGEKSDTHGARGRGEGGEARAYGYSVV
jgi:hypothetical protein